MKGAKIMTGRELVIHILSNGFEEQWSKTYENTK